MTEKLNSNIDRKEQFPLSINELKEKQTKEVCDFFSFSELDKNNFKETQKIISTVWLNFDKQLLGYQKYINENLVWLNPTTLNKIKKSIKIKLLKLDLSINNWNWEYTKEDRWIINDKIQEQLWFINDKLLPSASVLVKLQNKKITNRQDFWANVK